MSASVPSADIAADHLIASITARGVLGEFDYRVDYQAESLDEGSDRLRVVYAENGMGKTNFLRAVYHLLTPEAESLQSLMDLPVKSVEVQLTDNVSVAFDRDSSDDGGGRWSVTSEAGSRRLEIGTDDLDGRILRRASARRDVFDYHQMLKQAVPPTVMVGDDRLVYASAEPGINRRYYAEGDVARGRPGPRSSSVRDTLDQVERALTRLALASNARKVRRGQIVGTYLTITQQILAGNKSNLAAQARASLTRKSAELLEKGAGYERYGLISLQQVRGIVREFEGTRANDSRFKQLQLVLDPYLESLDEEIESLAPAQHLIDTFVTSVNSFLERKEMRFTATAGIALVGRREEILDPDALSSGEKHLLLLISNAILATFTNAFVIVDEPEISLGLKWQRSLLQELRRCTAGTGVKFLIASHSVQVMGEISDVVSPVESP